MANGNGNHVAVNGFYDHKDENKDEDEEGKGSYFVWKIFDIFGIILATTSSPWDRHHDENLLLYIVKWPLVLLLWMTVPDCKKHPKLRVLTFLCCILYIGGTSYVVSFLITIFGTFYFSFRLLQL